MAFVQYSTIVKLVALYVGDAKASGIVERQIKTLSVPPEQLTSSDWVKVLPALNAATTLYIPDPAKKTEFKSKLAIIIG